MVTRKLFVITILMLIMTFYSIDQSYAVDAQITSEPSVYFIILSSTAYADVDGNGNMTADFNIDVCVFNSTPWRMTSIDVWSGSKFNVSFSPSPVTILFNGCNDVHVTVVAPPDTPVGDHLFEIYGDWTTNMGEQGSIVGYQNIEFPQYYKMGINVEPTNITVIKNGSNVLNIEVRNLGNGRDSPMVLVGGNYFDFIKLKWNISFNPTFLDIIDSGEGQRITVTINVKNLPDPGDYKLIFYAASGMSDIDLNELESVEVKVIVPKKGDQGGGGDNNKDDESNAFIPGFGSTSSLLAITSGCVLISILGRRKKARDD